MEQFAKLLCVADASATNDKITFNKWYEGSIGIEECIRQFKRNNSLDDEVKIDQDAFVNWLWSLGYRRGGR